MESILIKIISKKVVSKIILSILLLPLFAVLIVPILLLPIVTSVPTLLWIIIVLVLIIASAVVMRFLKIRKLIIIFLALLFVNVVGTILSQTMAATPKIESSNGIATLEKVTLNGSEQWITIRGKNKNNPVLLYLGIGGPGAGGMPATFTSLKPLEENFVVVNWDQPGTGKSYNAVPIHTLTTKRIVDDAYALTNLMKKRFKQDKIYVMGLSWGTIVGIKLVQQHPEAFKAYIGNGQMVNTTENDRFGYNLALKISADKGDTRTYNTLTRYGPPPYEGSDLGLKYAAYNDVLFTHMDSPTIPMVLVLVPQFAPEYGYMDKINFGRGLYESFTVLYPQLKDLDFIKQANRLEVPVYFLVGKKDINAVASIVERYYNVLQAPKKKLIWLKSGHGATAEELHEVIVKQILL